MAEKIDPIRAVEQAIRSGALSGLLMPEWSRLKDVRVMIDMTATTRNVKHSDLEHETACITAWKNKYARAVMPTLKEGKVADSPNLTILKGEEDDGTVFTRLFCPIPITWDGLRKIVATWPSTVMHATMIREYVIQRVTTKSGANASEKADSSMAISLAVRSNEQFSRLYLLAQEWRKAERKDGPRSSAAIGARDVFMSELAHMRRAIKDTPAPAAPAPAAPAPAAPAPVTIDGVIVQTPLALPAPAAPAKAPAPAGVEINPIWKVVIEGAATPAPATPAKAPVVLNESVESVVEAAKAERDARKAAQDAVKAEAAERSKAERDARKAAQDAAKAEAAQRKAERDARKAAQDAAKAEAAQRKAA